MRRHRTSTRARRPPNFGRTALPASTSRQTACRGAGSAGSGTTTSLRIANRRPWIAAAPTASRSTAAVGSSGPSRAAPTKMEAWRPPTTGESICAASPRTGCPRLATAASGSTAFLQIASPSPVPARSRSTKPGGQAAGCCTCPAPTGVDSRPRPFAAGGRWETSQWPGTSRSKLDLRAWRRPRPRRRRRSRPRRALTPTSTPGDMPRAVSSRNELEAFGTRSSIRERPGSLDDRRHRTAWSRITSGIAVRN